MKAVSVIQVRLTTEEVERLAKGETVLHEYNRKEGDGFTVMVTKESGPQMKGDHA